MSNIIPKPVKEVKGEGKVYLTCNTSVSGDFKDTVIMARDYLAGIRAGEKNALTFVKDDKMGSEEYSVECKGGNIEVKAGDEAGAFYALMSLKQLADGRDSFAAVTIKDKPKYAYRGFMLDSARHFWRIDKVKQFLDVMANLKMNRFHWHLTDDQGWRVEIKKYPLLTEKGAIRKDTPLSLQGYWQNKEKHDNKEYGRGCFYTQDELKEVVAYAKRLHIEIIPEVDMPGHMVSAISCYPELSCTGEATEVSNRWGVMDNICCCGKDNVYNFAKDVIDELTEIFPYKYFHIGGDEVPKKRWKVCPKCQAKIKELGLKDENALQGYFNNEIAKYLKSKGRSMIGWNEILDASDIMDKEIIAQWWVHHSIGDAQEKNWMKNGGKVILSLVNYVYMDHAYAIRPLSKTYSFSYAKMGLKDDNNVVGMEIPQWTEYIRDEEKLDLYTYPRLITFSEVCWTQEDNKNYADFEARLESKRNYFKNAYGFEIAEQKVYRGKTTPWYAIGEPKKNSYWVKDPYFEVKINRQLKENK